MLTRFFSRVFLHDHVARLVNVVYYTLQQTKPLAKIEISYQEQRKQVIPGMRVIK